MILGTALLLGCLVPLDVSLGQWEFDGAPKVTIRYSVQRTNCVRVYAVVAGDWSIWKVTLRDGANIVGQLENYPEDDRTTAVEFVVPRKSRQYWLSVELHGRPGAEFDRILLWVAP